MRLQAQLPFRGALADFDRQLGVLFFVRAVHGLHKEMLKFQRFVVPQVLFGLRNDGQVQPKLPVSLVPMLFGKRNAISLDLPDRQITLQLPAKRDGNLLVADRIRTQGTHTTVTLKAISQATSAAHYDAYNPATINQVFTAVISNF